MSDVVMESTESPQPIHVLVVIDRYSQFGGAEGSTSLIIRELEGQGFRFTVFVLENPETADLEDLKQRGIPLVFGGSGGARTWRQLAKVIRSDRPDLVHAVLDRSEIVARVAALMTRTPVVVSLVNPKFSERMSVMQAGALKLRLHKIRMAVLSKLWTHRYHAISQAVSVALIQGLHLPKRKIMVIYRGRDRSILGYPSKARMDAARKVIGLGRDDIVLLSVGREDPPKGQWLAVEAFAATNSPNSYFVIAGRSGKASSKITETVEKFQIEDRVLRLGMRSDIPDLLCAADVVVSSALWEGLGGSVLEAMAMDVPIVAFDIPAVREATGGRAKLVPPGDVVALSRAIDDVLTNPQNQTEMIQHARARFEENFTSEIYLQRMADFYRDCAHTARTKKRYRRRQT